VVLLAMARLVILLVMTRHLSHGGALNLAVLFGTACTAVVDDDTGRGHFLDANERCSHQVRQPSIGKGAIWQWRDGNEEGNYGS